MIVRITKKRVYLNQLIHIGVNEGERIRQAERKQERAEAGGDVGAGPAAADEREVHGVKGRKFEFEQDRRVKQVIGWR